MCLTIAVSVLFITALVTFNEDASFSTAIVLASIGLLGIASGVAIIWSDYHKGRWSLVGFVFSFAYLAASVAPPVAIVTIHWYGPPALLLIVLSVWNVAKWRLT